VRFSWSFAPGLAPGEAFEVLIWQEGDAAHNGAEQATTALEQVIDLEQVPRIQQGGVGDYFWSVVVVRGTERVSPEAERRRFKYTGPPQPAAKPTEKPSEKPTPSKGVTPGG
jgi:hypothetical protein